MPHSVAARAQQPVNVVKDVPSGQLQPTDQLAGGAANDLNETHVKKDGQF